MDLIAHLRQQAETDGAAAYRAGKPSVPPETIAPQFRDTWETGYQRAYEAAVLRFAGHS